MRGALAVLFLFGLFIDPAPAQQRWCAINNEGASNCSFVSLGTCRDSVSGTGGNCMPEAPVGHLQPGPNVGKRAAARDERLDALIDRLNKKSDALTICRGC
jgi:hypothetical protein